MDVITGPLLIATWASSLLYTAELYQALRYYRYFKNDDWRLKMLVTITFSIDTIALLNGYVSVYLYTITHAGDTAYFVHQNWTIPLYVFATAIVASLVQIFLLSRYWNFAQKHVITLFLGCLILASFGGSVTCGVMVALFPTFKDRSKLKIPAILWLVTEAAADLGIAVALVREFVRAKPTSTEARNVVSRLATMTVQTGTATAAIAVAALFGYLMKEDSNICVGIAWCLGRTYVLSMLSNLNIRKSRGLWTPSTSKAATSTTRGTSVAFAQPDKGMDTNLSEPYVRSPTVVTVHIESQQDLHPAPITIKSRMHGTEHTMDIEMAPLSWMKEEELHSNTQRAVER
ncbi:hypothetical protein MSAN_01974100 [Mycena sanguinolenta]|uniref:DUF6534 domain-containing protein n=1 Tax=Mycena sanguinolenta TaxID=230812 RepID=A0A8H6XNC3_9AGAR|nr:hypothetical protein MSAN_01974100 [Mycena sanguinolenta]